MQAQYVLVMCRWGGGGRGGGGVGTPTHFFPTWKKKLWQNFHKGVGVHHQHAWLRDATESIPNFLKTSCEGAKRPRGGGGVGVPPPTVWSFFVFQCGIVCSGAYFRWYFHIFLHIISVFNWVLGTYCHIVIKTNKKTSLFLEISGNPENSGNVASLMTDLWAHKQHQSILPSLTTHPGTTPIMSITVPGFHGRWLGSFACWVACSIHTASLSSRCWRRHSARRRRNTLMAAWAAWDETGSCLRASSPVIMYKFK